MSDLLSKPPSQSSTHSSLKTCSPKSSDDPNKFNNLQQPSDSRKTVNTASQNLFASIKAQAFFGFGSEMARCRMTPQQLFPLVAKFRRELVELDEEDRVEGWREDSLEKFF